MKRFIIFLVFLTAVLMGIVAALKLYVFNHNFGYFIPAAFFCFFVLTGGGMFLLNNSLKGRGQAFVTNYMAYTTGKMFVSLLIIAAYLYLFRQSPVRIENVIIFAFLYLFYTAVEVVFLLKKNKTS